MIRDIEICYMFNRDYIDISTLCSALYKSIPEITNNSKMTDINIRIIKKVLYKCQLIVDEPDSSKLKSASVIFSWFYEGHVHHAFLIETSELISCRSDELVDDPKDFMYFKNDEVVLFNPINDDQVYNFMKMGKLIMVKKYSLIPRVAKLHLDKLCNKLEMQNTIMLARKLPKKNFYMLDIFQKQILVGEITVRAYGPNEI